MTEAPPAVVPPKGLAGILEGYDPGAVLDLSKCAPNDVFLNIYDVSSSELLQRINKWTTANNNVLVGGVFHAGVEVYGKEWCYGGTQDERTGVNAVRPRLHPQHTYRATVPMGTTKLSERELIAVLRRLACEWPGNAYDLIHHNCLSFCNALLEEIGLRRIPGWVDRAPRAACAIDLATRRISAETQQAVQLIRSVTSELETGGSERLADMARERAQAIQRDLADRALALKESVSHWSQDGASGNPTAAAALELGEEIGKRTSELGEEIGKKTSELTGRLVQSLQESWGLFGTTADSVMRSVSAAAGDNAGGSAVQRDDDDEASSDEERGGFELATACEQQEVDERATHGIVRMQEDRLMTRSLLDDDDEEEYNMGGLSPFAPRALPALLGLLTAVKVPAAPEAEAPIDWLSGDTAGPSAAAIAVSFNPAAVSTVVPAAPVVRDLLD